MLPFWEQLLLWQGVAALHAVVAKYAAKYYTPEETAQLQTAADLLGQLPLRMEQPTKPPVPVQ